jgi:hypothetical protein
MRTIVLLILCTTLAFAQNNYGGDDHDMFAHEIVEMTNSLRQKSIEDLRSYCIKVEKYSRAKEGQEHVVGGIEDFVWRLDEDACIKFILSRTIKNRELLSLEKFNSVVNPTKSFLSNETEPAFGHDGGLHDYIWREPREVIERWALTAEYHHREMTNTHVLGGIHDYIATMNKEEIIDYIFSQIKQHPELNSRESLEKLSVSYGFSN